jgi:hypothetical protein
MGHDGESSREGGNDDLLRISFSSFNTLCRSDECLNQEYAYFMSPLSAGTIMHRLRGVLQCNRFVLDEYPQRAFKIDAMLPSSGSDAPVAICLQVIEVSDNMRIAIMHRSQGNVDIYSSIYADLEEKFLHALEGLI